MSRGGGDPPPLPIYLGRVSATMKVVQPSGRREVFNLL
jgi:hypothetical protein